ncbi:Fe(2+) transporter permease subunit FeoB [Desulforhopalus vacuolatus]|uniref:Fe(2+) transporter permease subunit FeoB n=1 Tax=Desulforhopalus vacuolatus TaxID=40414 RepID=UPI001962B169|nr:Fe(2+) transporter permease subunit FeoB [Desulforhopalus vacuolatus]MBM9520613.1 Fe(2+) transporter permease subunit FeoB [Desulforhopalus vacuolatus]
MNDFTICAVGNPNCGKTTLFNALTGAKQQVGNWPGVTVERKIGFYSHGRHKIEVVDTPGIYSLSAASVDEEVARDYVLSGEADLIVNIVDASNLERNLYLTSQLLEMQVPLLVVLNMMDIARDRQIEIDVDGLSRQLGCPVIPMILSRNKGILELKDAINIAVNRPYTAATAMVTHPAEVEEAVIKLLPLVKKTATEKGWNAKWMAVKLLENDDQIIAASSAGAVSRALELQRVIEEKREDDPDILIASARYEFINWLTRDNVTKKGQIKDSVSDKIDRVVLNRVFGIPIFLAAMYLMFMFTINLGGAFIDFFDQFAGAIFVDGFGDLLVSIGIPVWLKTILTDGAGGGIQTMATFIPPIGFMFLFLSLLEDSGYMARAAFVMDRFMRIIGLPGKSFIPMLVGFGCNVPAIMATRTLENQRDRTLTIMMNPFMSCGARLPVYALFAAAFFPTGGQNLVFLLYLIGIAFAVLTGLILKNTLLKGETTPFIMELPPYHLPTVKAVLLRTYDRLKTFLFKAGKVLVPVIVVLAFLNSLGTDGSFGNEDTENSVLSSISKTITPALHPLGVTDENWPATVGVFTGIFAKEAVVGTLNALYSGMDSSAAAETGDEEAEEKSGFREAIGASFATIPANLSNLAETLLDPLGLSIGDVSDKNAAAEEMEVSAGTFGSMVTLFGSKVAAFSYLLFILLYFPCSAAVAAVYRETNLNWTLFTGFWTTFLAYFASTLFYQVATLSSHPASSLMWITGDLLALGTVVAVMKVLGAKKRDTISTPLMAAAKA